MRREVWCDVNDGKGGKKKERKEGSVPLLDLFFWKQCYGDVSSLVRLTSSGVKGSTDTLDNEVSRNGEMSARFLQNSLQPGASMIQIYRVFRLSGISTRIIKISFIYISKYKWKLYIIFIILFETSPIHLKKLYNGV